MARPLRPLLVGALALVTMAATGTASEQLGKVSFPTSCAPAVQADFDRAVATASERPEVREAKAAVGR
ncbi:MAG TPA: hypothetical protein VMQ51_00040 [Candidatus Binatia bacterium]|nr:hypothetical protein [Candidatus Binatia bacterium]